MISERFYQNGLVRSIHVDVEYAVSCCSTEALVRVCRDLRFVVLAQVARSGAVLLPLGQGVERVRAEAVLDPCGTVCVRVDGIQTGQRRTGNCCGRKGGAVSTRSLTVQLHEGLHVDLSAYGRIVGTLNGGIDTSTCEAEAAGAWAVLSDNRSPGGIPALRLRDGGALHSRVVYVAAVVFGCLAAVAAAFRASRDGELLHLLTDSVGVCVALHVPVRSTAGRGSDTEDHGARSRRVLVIAGCRHSNELCGSCTPVGAVQISEHNS